MSLLQQHDAPLLAAVAKYRAWTTDDELEALLVSNELWGGAGSVADSAALGKGRTSQRREIERVMIDLGTEQMRVGKTNARTEMWVRVFKEWQQRGI